MTLGDLLVLYGAAGVASAGVVYRCTPERGRATTFSALLAIPLWPLWLPVTLTAQRRASTPTTSAGAATRAAIWEAHEAVVGSALEPLLPRAAALRMVQEVERASSRHHELAQLLAQRSFSPHTAEARIQQLTAGGASAQRLVPARLHLENVRRLEGLRRRDEQTLLELGELATTLRTQLVLARYAGSTPHDAGDIVNEVWARVEVLGSTLDAAPGSVIDSAHASD